MLLTYHKDAQQLIGYFTQVDMMPPPVIVSKFYCSLTQTTFMSSFLQYATSEESMNEVEDPAEKDGEDTDSSPYDSTETEGRDSIADEHEHDDILHETNEGNNYPVGVSSHSNEHHTEDLSGNDVDESITQDNDDDNSVRIKQAQHKNWVYQKDSVALEELNEHSLVRVQTSEGRSVS